VVGATDAVVHDPDDDGAVARLDPYADRPGRGVFVDICNRLGDDIVDSRFDRLRQPALRE
jgi:hypothetical protein